ncbi:MAG: tRNA glutamyl-Q(34) synthetase GluQRS [Planctomycetota bacterium]|nr:tRNA glutamyl-Q(34) synthetase GluQRS [Planctomycetota bacterium]MDP6938758.1 tRNA glutamyl-Q(34) synthetase GluQRS [Planctomycetota bacterium]
MRGRLAPSPSGDLHLGHAWSFLLAWWQARALGGEIVLRLEDVDTERCVPESEASILDDLTWLGLDWDGAVVRQTDRAHLYQSALQALRATNLLYPCVCTRKELAEASHAPHADEHEQGAYPGTCRGLFTDRDQALVASGKPAAWRVAVPSGVIAFEDGCAGSWSEELLHTCGDFPVTRKDGQVAYQLAVVVDDAEMGITHVLRGSDLCSSTLRQKLLQEYLGLPHPAWFHVPLVVDAQGQRLAKRDPCLAVRALRDKGWRATEIIDWVAASAGQKGTPGRSAKEWIRNFDLAKLPSGHVTAPAIQGD